MLTIGKQISLKDEPVAIKADEAVEPLINQPFIAKILTRKAGVVYNEEDKNYYLHSQDTVKSELIKLDDDLRSRHIYVLGASGTGKSEMLRFWVSQDIKAGRGLGVFDPNSLLIKKVLNDIVRFNLPSEKVIVFIPYDIRFSIGFNPLEIPGQYMGDETYLDKLVSEVLDIFLYIWKDSGSGQRMKDLFRNAVYLLADNNLTLVEMPDLLQNPDFRSSLLTKCTKLSVKKYWLYVFNRLSENEQRQWAQPVLNRISDFVTPTMIQNIIGQRKSTINFEKIINNGYVLLVDLNPARLGNENAKLLGSLLTMKLQLAAFRRDLHNPRPWTLYADEFQNFLTTASSESFANILEQARKFNFNLVMAHQDLSQIKRRDPYLVNSILTNASTHIIFSSNHNDAKIFADQIPKGEGEIIDYIQLKSVLSPSKKLAREGYNEGYFDKETEKPAKKGMPGYIDRIDLKLDVFNGLGKRLYVIKRLSAFQETKIISKYDSEHTFQDLSELFYGMFCITSLHSCIEEKSSPATKKVLERTFKSVFNLFGDYEEIFSMPVKEEELEIWTKSSSYHPFYTTKALLCYSDDFYVKDPFSSTNSLVKLNSLLNVCDNFRFNFSPVDSIDSSYFPPNFPDFCEVSWDVDGSFYSKEDISNWPSLILCLKEHKTPALEQVGEYLKENLKDTWRMIDNYNAGVLIDDNFKSAVFYALNHFLANFNDFPHYNAAIHSDLPSHPIYAQKIEEFSCLANFKYDFIKAFNLLAFNRLLLDTIFTGIVKPSFYCFGAAMAEFERRHIKILLDTYPDFMYRRPFTAHPCTERRAASGRIDFSPDPLQIVIVFGKGKLSDNSSHFMATMALSPSFVNFEAKLLNVNAKVHYTRDTSNTKIINQILKLNKQEALCKIRGEELKLMRTIDTPQRPLNQESIDKNITVSNQKYATPKKEIEADMSARLERYYKPKPQREEKYVPTKAQHAPEKEAFFEIE